MAKVVAIAQTVQTTCWWTASGMAVSAFALFYVTMIY